MDQRFIGMCGAYCGTCAWKDKTNCPGCLAAKGKMFWGTCEVARCALSKGNPHCGLCPEMPCVTLKDYFDDPEHGDNGERLANLKAWANGHWTLQALTGKKRSGE
ncbi:MAG TPA: DUF3795 domain-containing protein [Thermotogota bacterium]|nr:DUF3795 domain-containing protein [Thermotogota bacterium]HPB87492.1 DUF3795 domain-containing protein [Thermotogota bacterium]HQN23015.1 DUF3795 domain-containing protein [Thermotogota bacterium]HQQ65778.1 DUF3795 domain-containing protein [Thermotogota bacterium]